VPEQRPSAQPPPPSAGERLHPELQRLRDDRVRFQARTAPLAIFVLAVLVVVVYLAAR
jgi:hypothetical protein